MIISASEITKQSVGLYFKHFKQIWLYLVISLAPTIITIILALVGISLEVRSITPGFVNNTAILTTVLIGVIISFWAYLGLIKVFDQIIKNQTIAPWKENFATTSKMILPGIFIMILTGLAILAGTLLFVIPGIILSVWYNFSVYALIADNQRGLTAMKASKVLVVGQWWSVLWRLIAPGILFAVASGTLQWLIARIIFWLPRISKIEFEILTMLANQAINLLTLPLMIGAGLILYENLKANPTVFSKPTNQV